MTAKHYGSIALTIGALVLIAACTSALEVGADQPPSTVAEATSAQEPTAVQPTAIPTSVPDPSTAAEPTAAPAESPNAVPTSVPEPTATPEPAPSPTPLRAASPEPTATPARAAVAETDHDGLAGTRGLTLQWISWAPDDWGTIEFIPLVDGTYAVSGAQRGVDGDYVTVAGIVREVNDRELLFTGDVSVHVAFNNNGQPCVRSGDMTFLATGDRRFWRLQDLVNCDGVVTDYVDIYFG